MIPLAQYNGYNAPVAGLSSGVRARRVALTQAEYENLNTVPKTIVPAIAGSIILPLLVWVQMRVTVAYGGNTTLALRYALGGPAVGQATTPNLAAIATVGGFMALTGAVFTSVSPPFPTGSALLLTGNALIGGGTLTDISVSIRYVVISGGL